MIERQGFKFGAGTRHSTRIRGLSLDFLIADDTHTLSFHKKLVLQLFALVAGLPC